MTYPQALQYMEAAPAFLAPGLARVTALLHALGNPQRGLAALHVAGTNGKGSTCAFLERMLRQGYKTGLFTSPYLQDFSERFAINGAPMPHEDIAALMPKIQEAESKIGCRVLQFEMYLALAFLWFARENVEVAVIETGMGGLWDATNVVTPILSVITPIAFDHMGILGDTLSEIAAQKAGIIKKGVPVATAPQSAEAMAVLQKQAQSQDAELLVVGGVEMLESTLEGNRFDIGTAVLTGNRGDIWDRVTSEGVQPGVCQTVQGEDSQAPAAIVAAQPGACQIVQNNFAAKGLETALVGAHQAQNAATAWCAMQLLLQKNALPPSKTGKNLTAQDLRHGLKTAAWPGRMEVLGKRPARAEGAQNSGQAPLIVLEGAQKPGHPPLIILDGAHNPHGAAALADALDALVQTPIVLVCAILDKDAPGMAAQLARFAKSVICTQIDHPRALPARELATLMENNGKEPPAVCYEKDPLRALQTALTLAGDTHTVVVAGSLFLVGLARGWVLGGTMK